MQLACSGTAPAGLADADTDLTDGGFIGGEITSGIGLRFAVTPDFGETFVHDSNEISVSAAQFTIVDLRLIGDAASGDARTSKDVVELAWDSDKPVDIGYPDAPAGMYSRVRGTVVGFSLVGDVDVEGESATYTAEKESVALPIEFRLDFNLEAGGAVTVTVEVDLEEIAEEIPFKDLSNVDGNIEIPGDSEAMEKIEEKISESFSLPE